MLTSRMKFTWAEDGFGKRARTSGLVGSTCALLRSQWRWEGGDSGSAGREGWGTRPSSVEAHHTVPHSSVTWRSVRGWWGFWHIAALLCRAGPPGSSNPEKFMHQSSAFRAFFRTVTSSSSSIHRGYIHKAKNHLKQTNTCNKEQ